MVQRAVLETRLAARRALVEWHAARSERAAEIGGSAPLVFVALSGGADSLALAAAVGYEAARAGLRAGAVVVDHGLQAGSAAVAGRAAGQAEELGLAPVVVRTVEVVDRGDGPEAAAREARYRAFAEVAADAGGSAVLTAHTRDDQAEQVLLGLARGSGLLSLAGMPRQRVLQTGVPTVAYREWSVFDEHSDHSRSSAWAPAARPAAVSREWSVSPDDSDHSRSEYAGRGVDLLRPFLATAPEITRVVTERACAEAGLEPWQDPHNDDPAYTRVRVRQRVLPVLETELGPGVAAALARTADLAREDAEALDALAGNLLRECTRAGQGQTDRPAAAVPREEKLVALGVQPLAAAPAALRQRAIRRLLREQFDTEITREHTLAIASLVTDWRGQGPIHVPGVKVSRSARRIEFRR